jgi:hypothetical protein
MKITKIARILGLHTFSHGEGYALSFDKMHWATFWAIFSQTHLVTLALT